MNQLGLNLLIVAVAVVSIVFYYRRQKDSPATIERKCKKRFLSLLQQLLSVKGYKEFLRIKNEIAAFKTEYHGIVPENQLNAMNGLLEAHSRRINEIFLDLNCNTA